MASNRIVPARAGRCAAFTLSELLVVCAIIVILLGILLPVLGLVRNSARAAATSALVATFDEAMQIYAAEDPRHFFPVPGPDFRLIYDAARTEATLTAMEARGFSVPFQHIDGPSRGGTGALLDGWDRPLRYRLDGRQLGVSDSSAENGIADRPAPVSDWNPRGAEPFAYVWSIGRPTVDDAVDAQPANAQRWIYHRSVP